MSSPSSHRLRGRWVLGLSTRLLAFLLVSCPAVQGLSYEAVITPTGEAPDDWFGYSVATAGDVNGDGFDDVIVGGQGHDGTGDRSGVARLYFGGVDMDDVADLVFMGRDSLNFLGFAVASAGDVNGDGYADVIVGASRAAEDAGAAYVYYGGAAPDTSADLTFVGEAAGDKFGWAVASAGDVNGDGYDDLIVGAKFNDATALRAGRAYVYYGGPAADEVADLIMSGEIVSDEFGFAVASAGDVNGDGHDDWMVGAPFAGGTFHGTVYVYFGGTDPDTTADVIIHGVGSEGLGTAMVAGDVNADGITDLIIGASGYNNTGPHAGRACVYYGSLFPDPNLDLAIVGQPYDFIGETVGVADVNSDGYLDVILGAPTINIGLDRGRTLVYHGSPDTDSTPDLILAGEMVGDDFGHAVAGAGDVNGDGHDDLLVGAPNVADHAGRAYVYTVFPYQLMTPNGAETWTAGAPAAVRWKGHDPADIALSTDAGATWSMLVVGEGGLSDNAFNLIAPWSPTESALIRVSYTGSPVTHASSDISDAPFRIVPPPPDSPIARQVRIGDLGEDEADEFGRAVALAGDVNGDGFDDVLVGAPSNDNAAVNAGAAYLYVGGRSGDAPALTLTGVGTTDHFGRSVAGGDVNGDGFRDLVVGAPLDDTAGPSMGQVYLYYGSSLPDPIPDQAMSGEASGDYFGISASASGDVNGDGYDDVVVGAPANDAGGDAAGRAYLFPGAPIPSTTAPVVMTGEAAGDHLGQSVAIVGDVNDDGYADFLVGAPENDAGAGNAGRAYLHLGGASPDESADLVFTGVASGDAFGQAVARAGDVNGDGIDDFAIGAPKANFGGADAGRVYLFLGRPTLHTTPDLVLDGHRPYEQLGYAISTAGDLNDDGFDDLVVGAPELVQGEDLPGRVYVYYGGPQLDPVADVALEGTSPGDGFGVSVSTAGDFMLDGFADLLVGAPQHVMDQDRPGYMRLYDFNRYHLLDPVGGVTWNVGAIETIAWRGAEPADVWLTADAGVTRERLRTAVGGQTENAIQIRVPHLPSQFSSIRITPTDPTVSGGAECDSLFTIDAAIVLTAFRVGAPPDGGPGVLVRWETDPGPEALSGYRLDRAAGSLDPSGPMWDLLVMLTPGTSYLDPVGGQASRYRLTAINGLGEAFILGEAGISPEAILTARPLPYRGGTLTVAFSTGTGVGSGAPPIHLGLYDVGGRLVRWLARGISPPGVQRTTWDGRDASGAPVASGVYFLRSVSGDHVRTMKVTVLR